MVSYGASQSPETITHRVASRKSINVVSHVNAMTDDDCSRHSRVESLEGLERHHNCSCCFATRILLSISFSGHRKDCQSPLETETLCVWRVIVRRCDLTFQFRLLFFRFQFFISHIYFCISSGRQVRGGSTRNKAPAASHSAQSICFGLSVLLIKVLAGLCF